MFTARLSAILAPIAPAACATMHETPLRDASAGRWEAAAPLRAHAARLIAVSGYNVLAAMTVNADRTPIPNGARRRCRR